MGLSSKHTPKAMARGYAIVTQPIQTLPVTAQDSSIHQMPPGVTTPTETATSLATISIRLTAGVQTTSMNSRLIS